MTCLSACCQEIFDQAAVFIGNAKIRYREAKAELESTKQELAKLQALLAKIQKQQETGQALIAKLRLEAASFSRVREELEEKLRAGSRASAGAFPFCVSRTPYSHGYPCHLMKDAEACDKKWGELFPGHKLTYGLSEVYAYGEPTFYTMARICHVIREELQKLQKPLKPGDVILDWGAGAGKFVCFARALLGVGGMIVLGIECNKPIFDICKNNLLQVLRSNVLHDRSQSFACFCPARVVYNYDGGVQPLTHTEAGKIHPAIMRAVFFSPTVDVVVSTRINLSTFNKYFKEHVEQFRGSVWKCIYIDNCSFQGSHFITNVWFRISPMHDTCIVDKRMEALLAGCLFFLRST